jgi:hypothetical protein
METRISIFKEGDFRKIQSPLRYLNTLKRFKILQVSSVLKQNYVEYVSSMNRAENPSDLDHRDLKTRSRIKLRKVKIMGRKSAKCMTAPKQYKCRNCAMEN